MPLTLEQLTQNFAKKANKTQLYAGGAEGEDFARRWLRANNWPWDEIDQTPEQLCEEINACGGKRPDFLAVVDADFLVLLDAKHHATYGCKRFTLRVGELAKYRAANNHVQEQFSSSQPDLLIETWFMVFPKECEGRRVVFIELSEMERGQPTFTDGPANWVSLENRPEWWDDNPE